MIKIPQVFFWKFYSRGKLTCTKTFCFVISTKECICNTQFHGLVTPTVHSSTPSFKNPKLREQLFSGKKAVPLMKVILIWKIGREKWRIWKISWVQVTNFSEVTKFFPDENFPQLFSPDKVIGNISQSASKKKTFSWQFQLELFKVNSGNTRIIC